VRRLEAEDLDLDEALKLFEKASNAARRREQLTQAELKVKKFSRLKASLDISRTLAPGRQVLAASTTGTKSSAIVCSAKERLRRRWYSRHTMR